MTLIKQSSYIDNEGDEIDTSTYKCDFCGKTHSEGFAYNYKDACPECFKKLKNNTYVDKSEEPVYILRSNISYPNSDIRFDSLKDAKIGAKVKYKARITQWYKNNRVWENPDLQNLYYKVFIIKYDNISHYRSDGGRS